jgi:hypothetical protein
MKNKYYVVQYNDCYGNGDTKLEVIVKNKSGFKNWLKEHNKQRRDMGEKGENSEEFDLIELNFFE